MGSVTAGEMREMENRAMESGVSEAELMERAGTALGRAIGALYPLMYRVAAYLGKGHNAGDALVALRVLRNEFGWKIAIRAAYPEDEWADLTRRQWRALDTGDMQDGLPKAWCGRRVLLLDGLVGIGAKGVLREPLSSLAWEMDKLRVGCGYQVAAVDLPSGVDPDNGEIFPGAVTADRTFMIAEAKRGLLNGIAANATGALSLVHVEGLSDGGKGMELICPQRMDFGKAPRAFDFHKGMAGRVGILAGSAEFSGAALIAVTGSLAGGGGLVTLFSRQDAMEAIRSRLPPEAMLATCENPAELLKGRFDALVVGPGLGKMSGGFEEGLVELISSTEIPMVIDADALNLLSRRKPQTDSRHILTPHPGEFERLAGKHKGLSREDAALEFVTGTEATLLLKGARTIVAKRGTPARINGTGTPAMANGGQGDLLSGVIGALLGQGMKVFDAASLGAWLCGRAAEISAEDNGSPATATEVAGKLGLALRDWQGSRR